MQVCSNGLLQPSGKHNGGRVVCRTATEAHLVPLVDALVCLAVISGPNRDACSSASRGTPQGAPCQPEASHTTTSPGQPALSSSPALLLPWPSPKRELVMVSNHTVLSNTVFQSGEDELSGCASRRMASPQLASV